MIVTACQQTSDNQDQEQLDQEAVEVNAEVDDVLVDLMNKDGKQVATATLTENTEGGVKIKLAGKDLPPGDHGFHIHDRGECTL